MQKKLALAVLFAAAGFLRLYALGYSDYQGDEIKALYSPKEATSVRFFLEQRKGPMQFLVTASLKGVSNDYKNRALVRLPFALAGLGSVIVFYLLAKALFNEKIAFYSTLFFATNGFLIAFSRLVQYQSLVIFFGLLAVYLTKKYTDSFHYLVLASVALAISILSHYDGVFFVPVILGLLYSLFRQNHRVIKHFIVPTMLFIILTGAFYIPFALNITQSTTNYWAGRISGDVSGKISSSRYLFSVYQPIYVLHIYTIFGIMGLGLITLVTLFKMFPNLLGKLLVHIYRLNVFKSAHSPFNLSILVSVLAWFLIPFVLLEVFIYIPGTHIYTYLIPVFLFMGFALFHIDLMGRKIFRFVIPTGIGLLFIFLTLQSYYVFVDHTYEYPWENKKFLMWTLPKPTPIFHLSMFGFPYYRHWDEIGSYIKGNQPTDFYTTNERVSISRYHIALSKNGEKAGYYIYIYNPQTFTNEITNKRINAWVQANLPVVQYKNQDRVVSEIYFVR